MICFGNVPSGAVLPVFFSTYGKTNGESITLTGLAVTDIEIYKGISATQRSSDAGYTLMDTDGIDVDGITGIHGFSIDTGDDTDSGFYAVGSFFTVVVSAVTIDSQTVNFIAATFRIVAAEAIAGKPKADVDAWNGTAVATPATAGIPDINVKNIDNDAASASGTVTFPNATLASTTNITGGTITTVTTVTGLTPATVHADLDDIQSRLPAALTADGNIKADTLRVGGTLQSAGDLKALIDAVDNFLDTEMPALTAAVQGLMLTSGTIGATGNDTTHLHLSGLGYADDAINSMLISIKDVSTGLFYSRWIEDFANTGDLATVATLPFTPEASVDLYWILPIRADVTGGSGLDAAGVRAAVGLASANLDTQLDALPTNAELATALGTADDAVLAAIAALNNLSQANIRSAVGLASANLDTQLDALPTAIENADALLNRDMATGTDSGSTTVRTVRQALRFLRNKWSISGTTLTVTKEDDSTASWTATLGTTAGVDPVTSSDPAGP